MRLSLALGKIGTPPALPPEGHGTQPQQGIRGRLRRDGEAGDVECTVAFGKHEFQAYLLAGKSRDICYADAGETAFSVRR